MAADAKACLSKRHAYAHVAPTASLRMLHERTPEHCSTWPDPPNVLIARPRTSGSARPTSPSPTLQ